MKFARSKGEYSMSDKVKLAIFDQDLVVRKFGKFELSSSGSKIKVKSGGEGHFMPSISNTTYLEFPRRSPIPPFKKYYERVYFVRNTASACVDFKTEEVPIPDPEQVMKMAGAKVASNWGKEKQEIPFLMWLILGGIVMILAKVFGVIV
jgi:hypothetical protein